MSEDKDILKKFDTLRKNKMHDIATRVHDDKDGDGFLISQDQNIPKDYLSGLKTDRMNSLNQKEGETMRVASVPVAVHEQWLREGFNMYLESAHNIIKRLQNQDLHSFITTKKQV